MNKVYSKVWNKSLGQVVVASELATRGRAGVAQGAGARIGFRRLLGAVGSLFALSGPIAHAQDASWTLSNGADSAVVGDGDTVTVQSGDDNIDVAVDADGGLTLTLSSHLSVDSVSAGDTVIDGNGVTLGANVVLGASGLSIIGGPSVMAAGIDAGNKLISGVADGIAGTDAVNKSQLDAVLQTASAGWTVTANTVVDGDAGATVAPGGSVDFTSIDGNIEIGRDGTNLNFYLANDIAVDSVEAGGNTVIDGTGVTVGADVTLGATGLTIVGGPSVTTVGIDAAGQKITNVADGEVSATSTDAVTGKQIHDLFIETGATGVRYFHANSVVADSEATGAESIAIGPNAVSGGSSSFAAGDGAYAGTTNGIALGVETNATAASATAIGDNAEAAAENALAVGTRSEASSENSTAIGFENVAAGDNKNTAVGNSNIVADGYENSAVGASNQITANAGGTANNSTAQGSYNIIHGDRSVAVGYRNTVNELGFALGASNNATAAHGTAIGDSNSATGENSTALGRSNTASDNHATALGADNQATAADSTALGRDNMVSADNSTALGRSNVADGNESVALGARNQAIGSQSVAIGNASSANASGSIAMGNGASTDGNANDAIALGSGATAVQQGAVALGSGSVTDVAVGTDEATVGDISYGGFAGTAPSSTVSVGAAGAERTVTNVAAGRIDADSTDAINGSQLFATQTAVGKVANSVVDVLGGNAAVDGDGNITMGNDIGGTGESTVNEAIAYAAQGWTVTANKVVDGDAGATVAPGGSVDFTSIDGNIEVNRDGTDLSFDLANGIVVDSVEADSVEVGGSAVIDNTGVAVGDDVKLDDTGLTIDGGPSVTVEGIDAGGSRITNVADGVNDDDAATVAQINAAKTHYYSVHSADDGAGSNYDNDGATGDGALAAGLSAQASGDHATAVGDNASAGSLRDVAVGTAASTGAIAGATADQGDNIALGSAEATGGGSISIGRGAVATGSSTEGNNNATAVGYRAQVNDYEGTALGSHASTGVDASSATAIGSSASVADGAYEAVAIGAHAQANATSALAIGSGAVAAQNGSVALGADSVTASVNPVAQGTVDGITYDYAGTTPQSVVSVGSAGAERQIINVAAGRVTDDSTDAINGSQLFATQTAIGNIANSVKDVLGGDAAVDGDGNITMGNDIGGTGESTIDDAIAAANDAANVGWNVTDGTNTSNIGPNGKVTFNGDGNVTVTESGTDDDGAITVALNKNLGLGATGSVTTGDTVMNNDGVAVGDDVALSNAGLTIVDGANDAVSLTGSGLDNGGNKIANVAEGVADSDAVNVRQLSTAAAKAISEVVGGTNVASVTSTTNAVDGHTIYTVNADGASVSAGSGAVAVTKGTTDANNVTDYAVDLSQTSKDSLTKADSAVQNVVTQIDGSTVKTLDKDDNTANFVTGKNIVLSDDGAGGIEVANVNDLDVDSVTAGDSLLDGNGLTVDDGAGNATTVTTGGTEVSDGTLTTTTNAGGVTIIGGTNGAVALTDSGLDNGGNKIANVAPGVNGTDAVNKDQLDALADTPITFAGDTGTNVDRKLGETVSVTGGETDEAKLSDGNIGVVADGSDTLELKLAKNIDLTADGSLTAGDTMVNDGGVAVGDEVALDDSGLSVDDGAGNGTTTTVAGTTVTNAAGDTTAVGAGTIAVTDGNGTTTISGHEVAVGGANPITISGDTGTIGGLTNKTFDPDNYTSGQAATEDQLKSVSDVANAGWNVSAEGEGALADGSNNVAPGGTVDFSNTDGNVVIARAGTDLTFDLAENIDLGDAGSVVTGDTVVNNDSVAVDDGAGNKTEIGAGNVAVTDDTGVTNIGGNLVDVGGAHGMTLDGDKGVIGGLTNTTFDPDAITSGQAATEDQLKSVSDVANAGWNVADADGNSNNIGPNGKVTFNGDSNVTVTESGNDNDGAITVVLNKDLDLSADGSVATGNSVLDDDGLQVDDGTTSTTVGAGGTAVTDGTTTTTVNAGGATIVGGTSGPVTLTGNGLDNGGNTITNVAAGVDGTDAVNKNQLDAVSDVANAGWNVADANGNSDNIGPNGKVTFNGDSNITVTESGNDNDGAITVVLNKDLDLSADGSVAIGGTVLDSSGVAVGDDVRLGDTGLTIDGGPSVTVGGIVAGGSRITNVAAGSDPTDAVNLGQLNDAAAAAMTEVQAGTNVAGVTATTDADDGHTIYTVNADGASVSAGSGAVAVTKGTADANNVTDYAVDLSQASKDSLTKADSAVQNVVTQIDGSTVKTLDKGDNTANFVTGKNIVLSDDGAGGIEVATQDDVNFDSVKLGDTGPTLNSDGGNLSVGGARITKLAPGVDGTDAVNKNQLDAVSDVANAGWNVADASGNTHNIGPDGKVTFNGDDNITVTESGDDDDAALQVALKRDLDLDSVTTGGTVIDNDGLAIAGGPKFTRNGIDAGNQVINGVADGVVDDDAVNLGQLNDAADSLNAAGMNFSGNDGGIVHRDLGQTLAITGGATTAGTFSGGNIKTVTDAATGAVQIQIADSPQFGDITINVDGSGRITGVAKGIDGTDAVNKDQLDAVSDVANAGWNVSAQGANASNVKPGDSVDLHNNDGNIVVSKTDDSNDVSFDLADDIKVDSVSLGDDVKLDRTGLIIVGGPSVTVNGIDAGGTKITNLAPGTDPTDAVNKSQLDAVSNDIAQLADNAVQYDDGTKGQVTLGGDLSTDGGKTGGTTITNVHRGDLSADSTDAVNGSQLYETNQNVANNTTAIENIQNGNAGYFQVNDSSGKGLPKPTGEDATAGGAGAVASARGSTALGAGAVAMADNSVALGAGSVADRANSVSMGVEGGERQVTHVAAGTEGTDAVNLNQLRDGMSEVQNWAQSYTDARVSILNDNLNRYQNRANAGVASAMAMASLPQVYRPDQSAAAVSLSNFRGESAFALGLSTITDSGRYVFKLNASSNTRGDTGVGVGAAIMW